MSQSQVTCPLRPSLALRIGITGTRKLLSNQLKDIRTQLTEMLRVAKQRMQELAHEPMVEQFYSNEEGAGVVPIMRMTSPLARGADRLAAEAALDLGYELHVPMPFAQAEYEKDFTGSDKNHPEEVQLTAKGDLEEFGRLLAQALTHFALDGARDQAGAMIYEDYENHSYESVGRFVVMHCDLLIAIWDGKPSNGRGGTADIVRFAIATGIPVWWIHATVPQSPVWLGEAQDLRNPVSSAGIAESKLRNFLNRLILVPPRLLHVHHNWLRRMILRFRKGHTSPAATYFAEMPRKKRAIWKTYSKVMYWTSRLNPPWTPPRIPDDPVPRYWFDRYQPADERAGEYASRYRSTYVLVIILTTLALAFGALALGFGVGIGSEPMNIVKPTAAWMAGLELFFLTVVVALVVASQRREWHERSIEYRLLAELFRKQQTLAPLGWTLSIVNVQQLTDAERQSWVAWLFAAMQRAAPMLEGDLNCHQKHESSRAALNELIKEQLEYHNGRSHMAQESATTFEILGIAVFVGVLGCVGLKLVIEAFSTNYVAVLVLGLMATVLPGVSAAFVGIRSYAELQLLAEQSRHMIAEIERAKERVDKLDLTRPLVSQDLGAEALNVATIMLQDLDGWGRLFRGKATEA